MGLEQLGMKTNWLQSLMADVFMQGSSSSPDPWLCAGAIDDINTALSGMNVTDFEQKCKCITQMDGGFG